MSDSIISVSGLGKKYRISHQADRPRYTALRDVIAEKAKGLFRKIGERRGKNGDIPLSPLSSLPSSRGSHEDFWALKDVSFEVKRGEVVGIIGRNGAGKSTLLKILSRITEPTTGEVRLRGRVASLLEVGTGFHPELTGRENVFLNGAILGMSRLEIKRKFDEIVAFAEVEKFLDTPVKRYSSGMYVRLAFAVAAHLEPEILIVDEVLAVGDAEFQKKCLGKMESVSRSEGRTVLFVSHNMQAIRNLAPKSVLLSQGQVVLCGDTKAAVERYLGQDGGPNSCGCDTSNLPRKIPGSGQLRVQNIWFTEQSTTFDFAGDFEVGLRLNANQFLSDVFFDITFFNLEGESAGTSFSANPVDLLAGRDQEIKLHIPNLRLAPGRYYCDVAVLKGTWLQNLGLHDVVQGVLYFEISAPLNSHEIPATWYPGWGGVVFNDIVVVA
jgi:lipopolysaccharide transport system ATP-binding protein